MKRILGWFGYMRTADAIRIRQEHVLDAVKRHQANLEVLIARGQKGKRIVEVGYGMAKPLMQQRMQLEEMQEAAK